MPLAGVRVVDTTDGAGEMCARFLADLGAEVVLVEPLGGAASRRAEPAVAGASVAFAVRAANKRSLVLDLASESGRSRFDQLLAGADIWINGHAPGELDHLGLAPDAVHARHRHLVVATITDFGRTGPYRDWKANDWMLFALGGQLSRSGVPDRPPLMLPGDLADETSAIQAAWAVLLAYWTRLERGGGDVVDVSRFEATAQSVDPAFGSIGTAAAQHSGGIPQGRGRSVLYPVFACADGYVRIILLAPRQWHGLRAWLGEPEEFADNRYDAAAARFEAADRLYPLIAAMFRDLTMLEAVAEGQRRGVPISPVMTPGQAMRIEHFASRGLFTDLPVGATTGTAPTGHVLIDGRRAGIRTPAPVPGEAEDSIHWEPRAPDREPRPLQGRRPLAGLRVLDLGVIIMGGEAGRLFADQGADVIKVENRRFPDGSRAAGMTPYFAAGHRNKRSLGIDLRHARGRELFERLVTRADVLLSNFKPGTLESLGLGPQRLRQLNPGLVVVTSSAMGEWGPWRDWVGYGPLVRCVAGLTYLWCDPEPAADGGDGFGDATTIYPDHFVARVVDTAALAALIGRRRSGRGAHVESSQAESIIAALAPQFLRESIQPGSARPRLHGEFDAPWGIYPCRGDDEWCAITVGSDAEWAALVTELGSPAWATEPAFGDAAGRRAARADIDRHLAAWTAEHDANDLMRRLQEAGVAAGRMAHVRDLPVDPQLVARRFYLEMLQPGVPGVMRVETGPAAAASIPAPATRPAPFYGQHTREIARDLLDLPDTTIDALVEAGVLDELSEQDAETLSEYEGVVDGLLP
jgi:crotonobetainyl-CoA:carnitine CoA-transferase CaiB-like acyl-CoA transferase